MTLLNILHNYLENNVSETQTQQSTHSHLESLRKDLLNSHQQNQQLRSEIELLRKLVAEEQEAKYRAYVRIADLTKS